MRCNPVCGMQMNAAPGRQRRRRRRRQQQRVAAEKAETETETETGDEWRLNVLANI